MALGLHNTEISIHLLYRGDFNKLTSGDAHEKGNTREEVVVVTRDVGMPLRTRYEFSNWTYSIDCTHSIGPLGKLLPQEWSYSTLDVSPLRDNRCRLTPRVTNNA